MTVNFVWNCWFRLPKRRKAWQCEEPIWQYIYVYGVHCYFHPSSIYFTPAHGNVPSQWRVLFHKNCTFLLEQSKNTHPFQCMKCSVRWNKWLKGTPLMIWEEGVSHKKWKGAVDYDYKCERERKKNERGLWLFSCEWEMRTRRPVKKYNVRDKRIKYGVAGPYALLTRRLLHYCLFFVLFATTEDPLAHSVSECYQCTACNKKNKEIMMMMTTTMTMAKHT